MESALKNLQFGYLRFFPAVAPIEPLSLKVDSLRLEKEFGSSRDFFFRDEEKNLELPGK